jgi:hypothetical protein
LTYVTDEELRTAVERAHAEGERAAQSASSKAPPEPLLRIAWLRGFEDEDAIKEAVRIARRSGATWTQIAIATNEADAKAAEVRYGGGAERARRYRARKRGDDQPPP